MAKQDWREVSRAGVPCIKCGQSTQIREHKSLREKHFKQPFYFKQWYNCINSQCKTTVFMREEDKVWNNNKAAQQFKDIEEDQGTLDFIRNMK